jgi:hypothetical protein
MTLTKREIVVRLNKETGLVQTQVGLRHHLCLARRADECAANPCAPLAFRICNRALALATHGGQFDPNQ